MADNDVQSQHEFEHFHRDHARTIKEIVEAAKKEASGINQKRVADMFDSFFGAEAGAFLDPADVAPRPEAVLRQAMSKMNDANRLQLVVGNLLEGVKRGEDIGVLAARYEALGLINPGQTAQPNTQTPPSSATSKDGSFLEKALGWARKIGSVLCRMGWNAIRTIPHFVKLEPEMHLGFVGPLPTFSLTFKLKADGVSIHELGEALFQGVGAT